MSLATIWRILHTGGAMPDEIETDVLPPKPPAPRHAGPPHELVNRLVSRTGCTIREAEITLRTLPRPEQEAIAAGGRVDYEQVRAADLERALALVAGAGLRPDQPCPYGAPKGGEWTWADACKQTVDSGRLSNLAELLKRVA